MWLLLVRKVGVLVFLWFLHESVCLEQSGTAFTWTIRPLFGTSFLVSFVTIRGRTTDTAYFVSGYFVKIYKTQYRLYTYITWHRLLHYYGKYF